MITDDWICHFLFAGCRSEVADVLLFSFWRKFYLTPSMRKLIWSFSRMYRVCDALAMLLWCNFEISSTIKLNILKLSTIWTTYSVCRFASTIDNEPSGNLASFFTTFQLSSNISSERAKQQMIQNISLKHAENERK